MIARAHALFIFICTLSILSCSQKKDEPVTEKVDTTTKKESKPLSVKDTLRALIKASADVPKFQGRCINVSICGIDARLNQGIRHADANHVIRFWLDSGAVEIVDIPRDTPVDAGLDSNLNILTNLRANRGRKVYLDTIAKIVGAKKIDYYCELGFSQAMGMLELLGHKDNAAQTLRVLRSRQGFDAGDFQRCYNQGTFISQVLTRHFGKATGWFRDPMLRAALLLVETNLPLDTMKNIIDVLEAKNFPENKKCYVHIMPDLRYKLPSYDFTDDEKVSELNAKIDAKISRSGIALGVPSQEDYVKRLDSIITRASADSVKRPRNAIALLSRPYEQRAWMQVSDQAKRSEFVERICSTMIAAYNKSGRKAEALKIKSYFDQHRELFEGKLPPDG